jgi:hypothetical protein
MIYGTRASRLGSFQVKDIPCPYCEHVENQNMSIFGRYAHIMWIPFFPVGKTQIAECTRCQRTYDKSDFSEKMHLIGKELKGRVKSPLWMWAGLGIVGLFFLGSILFSAFKTVDPRDALLNADLEVMTSATNEKIDSISFKIDQVMTMIVNEELHPEDFRYLSKVRGDKALVLLTIPDLDDLVPDERPQILELMETIAGDLEDLADKQVYYGIMNHSASFKTTKTPEKGLENGSFDNRNNLLAFYGPAPK